MKVSTLSNLRSVYCINRQRLESQLLNDTSWIQHSQLYIMYLIASFLSRSQLIIQHPTQKMDYGGLNRLLGREVDQEFWGTRTQHILGVAGCLALTDHASQAAFQSMYKKELCFAKSPAAFVAHTFLFIFTGVTLYCAGDAALNPNHKDEDRLATFKGETYNSYVGSNTAWVSTYILTNIYMLFYMSDMLIFFPTP